MAYEESVRSITLEADASIGIYTGVPGMPGSADPNDGKQYRFVKVTGAHTAGLATSATDNIIGVLQNKPQGTGQAATVAISGVSKVMAGTGGVSAGDLVAPEADGEAVTDAVNGTCVALADGAAGALVPVLLKF